MEETINNTANISQIIIETINNLLNTLFSSIDNSVYETLDDLAFINVDFIQNSFFEKTFGININNGLLLIANSLLIAVCLYYSCKLIYSHFTGTQIERPYQFVAKLLIFGIFINSSYFICEFFLYFNSLISGAIRDVGQVLLGQEISFSTLVQNINSVVTIDGTSLNVFSLDGLLQSIISISFISLLFSYSIRYIMLSALILLTPFAFLTLINNSTSWFFKAWLKIFLSILFIQPLISIILLIVFALDFSNSDILTKVLCIGSIYALIRANSYVQSFIGGISTDVSQNLNFLKSRSK